MSESKNNPVVSVITSTYNRSDRLRRAIESVQRQRFSEWQMCVVGDCTPDNSEDVVTSFGDPRIQFYNLPEKSPDGAHGALAKNYAIKQMARGAYIAYLDDDDEYLPDYLAVMMKEATKHSEADFIYCRSIYRDEDTGKRIYGNPFQRFLHGFSKEKLTRYNFLNTNGVIHKKALVDQVGPWNAKTYFDDYDLWLRMSIVTDFHYVNRALVVTYLRGELPLLKRAISKGWKILKHGGKRMPRPYDGDYSEVEGRKSEG